MIILASGNNKWAVKFLKYSTLGARCCYSIDKEERHFEKQYEGGKNTIVLMTTLLEKLVSVLASDMTRQTSMYFLL